MSRKSKGKKAHGSAAREPEAGSPASEDATASASAAPASAPSAPVSASPGVAGTPLPASPNLAAARSDPAAGGPAASAASGNALWAAVRIWATAYKVELLLFVVSYAVLASFSSQRFLRQSEAPHFVYQAKGWLEGRLDLDPEVLPNLEDWACVREVNGVKRRCEGRVQAKDRWFVSFPSFPAVVMVPFVAIHGYQFNDTSFGVAVGALAVALFYSLLRLLAKEHETGRSRNENIAIAVVLAFGTVFFYCAIRGEVWFSAEVMGVALTCLYARNSVRARRPVLAGLFFSMAVLTRTPLVFTGLFFLLECLAPEKGRRLEQLGRLGESWREPVRKLGLFAAGAAPLASLAAAYNVYRFGSASEFGHAFLYNNRVNVDIDRLGLFNVEYLPRNLEAAFLKLPVVQLSPLRLAYDPHGLTLLLTLPLLVFIVWPKDRPWVRQPVWMPIAAAAVTVFLLLVTPAGLPAWAWAMVRAVAVVATVVVSIGPRDWPRLHWPLWLTVAACALPGLFYQNTGYMQFGFRFSLDYTPYLMLLFAIGGWSLKSIWVQAVAALGMVVNFWGAVAFCGYTELVRRWCG